MKRAMFDLVKTKKVHSYGLHFLIVFFLSVNNFLFAQFVPELLYPHPNEVTNENNITFKWNKDVFQNLTYQFQLSIDATFSSLISDQTTTDNYFSVTSLSNYGQTHFWRVRSSQGAIVSNWSSVDSFLLFAPTSINGLVVWLDPNIGVVLNGPNVQSINDNTLNFNNAAQVSISQQPLFVSSDSLINNKSIIRFDGIDDFLEIADNATIDFSNAFSMFVLVKPTIIATNKTIMAKWDYQTQGSWAFQTDFSSANQLMFAPCFNITDPGNQKVFSTNANMQILTPALVNLVYNGGLAQKVKMYKNAIGLNTGTLNSIPSVLPNSTATLKIGKYGGLATRYYEGDIGEILIYNSDITLVQKTLVDNYLRYKYAPPVSLGPDTLTDPTTLCTNITLKAQSKYQTYLWSNSSTASSINVTQPGVYWVTVTDFLGNTSSDTINVFSIDIPTPTFTGICVNETMTWDADLGPGFTYLWSPNSETTPSISITTAGTYSVQVTDAFFCTKNSGDYTFAIDTYSQTTFLGNDTTLCSGNFIGLQVGAAETVSYTWPAVTPPNQASYAVDTTGNYFVETVNANGCIAQDTILVTITGTAPVADFSFQNACLNKAINFTDQSVPSGADAIAIWKWNLGNGSPIQTTPTINYTYPASGTYNVLLYVESIGGCGAFHTETVQVYANPTANFSSAGHCQSQAVQFTNTSSVGDAALTNYFWNFDMPWSIENTSTIPVPNRDFDTARTYDVFFRVTDTNGCKDSIVIPVVIDPTPVAEFLFADACLNTPINFTNTSVTQPFSTYFWDFDDGTNSILTNPSKTYTSPGGKIVTLEVTNTYACIGTVQHNVEIFANPVAVMDLGPYCMGTYMEATDLSTVSGGTIDSSIWLFNTTDSLIGSPVKYLIPTMGQQSISLTTFSNQGCSATINQFINVTSQLQASFDIGAGIAAAGSPFSFTNTSTSNALYLWNFGDGTFSSVFSPEHSYNESYIDSSLDVYLMVLNIEGCVDTAYQTVLIERARIDLELTTLYLQKQGDWYIVGVKMTNRGSVDLASANLILETSTGLLFNETWNGSLAPLEDSIYVFTAQAGSNFSDQDGVDAFICVQGIGFDENGVEETYLDNNKVCKNIEGQNVILMPIYPNPVVDDLHVQLIVSVASEVSVTLIDLRGREVRRIVSEQTLAAGLYDYSLNIDQIQDGAYYVRLISGDAVVLEKVVVGN